MFLSINTLTPQKAHKILELTSWLSIVLPSFQEHFLTIESLQNLGVFFLVFIIERM